MSWLFSRALVEAFSEATSSGGEPSAPLSGNPTPQAFLPPDRMTAFSRPSRFGMTFKPLTDGLGAAVLMWCQEVSRARTSASQAKEPALTEPAAECGDTWRGSLARFDPATSSWRTAQPSLLEDLGESSVIWPRSGMTAAGRCWELPTLEHRTSGTGSGLSVPTPTVYDSTGNGTPRKDSNLDQGGRHGVSLHHFVAKWPTPTASAMPCEGTQRIMRKKWLAGELSLEEASAIAGRDVRKAQGKVPEMWPTPVKSDSQARRPSKGWNGDSDLPSVVWQVDGGTENPEKPPAQLNADWVEWLMGWPLGWTDLKPLATGKSPFAPQQHSNY
jgi:hypothetical protein